MNIQNCALIQKITQGERIITDSDVIYEMG